MAADHDALRRRLRIPCKDNDVFLSFRGKDTRLTFTSHLYQALREKGIKIFIDDSLRRGEYVDKLFSEIKRSRICIVVFSINYAGSVWCLNELAQMIQDKEIVVLPIFYRVSPSDVRRQTGHVGNHFESNEKIRNSRPESIRRWRNALTKLGNISGFEVIELKTNEAEIIQQVVYRVSRILERLAADNNYNRQQWDDTFEKQWYSRIFGEDSIFNMLTAIPVRQTVSNLMQFLGKNQLSAIPSSSQTTSQDHQANLPRRSSGDDVTTEVKRFKCKAKDVVELEKEVGKRKSFSKMTEQANHRSSGIDEKTGVRVKGFECNKEVREVERKSFRK